VRGARPREILHELVELVDDHIARVVPMSLGGPLGARRLAAVPDGLIVKVVAAGAILEGGGGQAGGVVTALVGVVVVVMVVEGAKGVEWRVIFATIGVVVGAGVVFESNLGAR
jgi:hypothetical protein